MSETITFEDFSKIDLRVGTIIEVNDFPEAHKPAYQLTIDFGDLGIKKTSAQITALYAKEDLLDRQIVANVNFEEKHGQEDSNITFLGYDSKNDEISSIRKTGNILNETLINESQ